ncbi:hypothetical protein IGJ02_000053 [Enterococcus sp. DIV0724b]|uniref:ImmA/IrrE family metallo-endopeptidase n=1 Tax=Enterococcus sp. DIV0724b TaxID=2774694 RepID=UPI003D2FD52F
MFKYMKEYVDFSVKLNDYISTFMLDNGISCEEYKYSQIWELVQSQGVTIRGFKFNDIASGPIAGLLIQDRLETTIGFNQELDEKSKNFAISHEIIHYLFHMDGKNQLFFDTAKNMKQWHHQELHEFQANIGASMILIPDSVLFYSLEKGWNISQISTTFGLSEEALTSRLILMRQANLWDSFKSAKVYSMAKEGHPQSNLQMN